MREERKEIRVEKRMTLIESLFVEGKRTLSSERGKTGKENEKTRETTTTTIVHFVLLSFQAWN